MKVSLVLGSGGARGLSYLGVLRALARAGIEIEEIAGTSMGAIIGAAFGSCSDLDVLSGRFREMKLKHLVGRPSLGPGLMSPSPLKKFLEKAITVRTFDQLTVHLSVFCTDLQTGKSVSFSSGEIIPPVLGSGLMAGGFTPVSHEGYRLVDGGYTEPVPLVGVKMNHPAVVVDPGVIPDWPFSFPNGPSALNLVHIGRPYQQFLKSFDILIYHLTKEKLKSRPHIYIAPELEGIQFTDFHKFDDIVLAGEKAVTEKLPEIVAEVERCQSLGTGQEEPSGSSIV